MTRYDIEAARAAIGPLRLALLRQAREDADEELAEARRWADGTLAEARATADDGLAAAAAAGRADASEVIAAESTKARRAARALELTAQREVYDELCRRVAEQISELATGPGWRDRLSARVRALLGPTAEVIDAPGGGVVGQAPGRRVDLSVGAIVEGAVGQLGEGARTLWAP